MCDHNKSDSSPVEYPDNCYIRVIGKDNKLHIALSWEDKTICGIEIKTKDLKTIHKSDYFSCYECTY